MRVENTNWASVEPASLVAEMSRWYHEPELSPNTVYVSEAEASMVSGMTVQARSPLSLYWMAKNRMGQPPSFQVLRLSDTAVELADTKSLLSGAKGAVDRREHQNRILLGCSLLVCWS